MTSSEPGGTRTLDLTVAPPTRSIGRWLWLVLVAGAAGGVWATFFRDDGAGASTRPTPNADGRLEKFSIDGRMLSVRVTPDWQRVARDDGSVAFDLPVPGDGTVTLVFSGTKTESARSAMNLFLESEAMTLSEGTKVLFDRFRWLDVEGGLGAHEVVLGESDARPITTGSAREHVLWIEVADKVVRSQFAIPPNAPDLTVDQVEQVIATLRAE